MQAEYLSINEGGERQIVEQVGEILPHIRIPVFSQTFVVESVNLRDLSRLVISTEDGDSFAIANLESDEECYSLNRVVSTIDVVAHEQIVCIGRASAYPKQFHQVVKLTVNIAAYCHRAFDFLNIWFLSQNLLCLK